MKHFSRGFTIIELMVVIAVIGILASVSVFAFGNWRERVATNEVKSDLKGVRTAMESARNFDNVYPSSIPSTFTASPGVEITYGSDGTAYCVQAASKARPTVIFRITNSSTEPVSGACPAVASPNTPIIASGSVGFLLFNESIYVSISAPSGPAVASYRFEYRSNTSQSWTIVTPNASSSPRDFEFTSGSPLVASYKNNTSTGELRVIAVGSGGSSSSPQVVPYSTIAEWE